MAIAGFTTPEPIGFSCANPDDSQQRVLSLAPGSSAVIVGAPGTGKTSVAIELVARRVFTDGWSADDIVVLTPNRLAANRLRDAISTRLALGDVTEAASGPRARTPMSLAFSIAAEQAIVHDLDPVRLLTGAEQDAIINDLLIGEIHDNERYWPEELHEDIRVRRVFRTELRELFGRAQEHGLSPEELARLAHELQLPAWESAAQFWKTYRSVVAEARPDHFDASELLAVAAGALADPLVMANVKLIILDDAQEATAGVINLLRAFAQRGVAVVVLGDPDESTTTFRGAIPEFLGRTATDVGLDVAAVEQIVLTTVHRHGSAIREVVTAFTTMGSALVVGQRAATPAAPGELITEQTHPQNAPVLSVRRDSRTNEMSALGRILREQHLKNGVPWNRMAVITRNGALVSAYARGLAVADVPTRSLISESSLQQHSVTRDMMMMIKLALGRAEFSRESAAEMLTSPFGGLSALELRRLRLAFRHEGLASGNNQPGSDALTLALRNPALFAQFDFGPARRAARVAETLELIAEAAPTSTIEELLWTVWNRSGLAKTWREAALSSGIAADEANRNLDAVIALFTAARRFVERQPEAPAEQFITEFERTDVPEDSLAPQADSSSVLVATPSGVIGAEFDVVVVGGVQENVWPNLRPRGTLLFPHRLVRHMRAQDAESIDARREVSDDEKRMFAMAVSRARLVLIVSAHDGEDDMPSPYFERVANRSVRVPETEDDRAFTLRGLVAGLRRRLIADSPESADSADAAEAATALAKLAEAEVAGAHPDSWLGLRDWSTELPIVDRWSDDDNERIRLSPSKLESWEKDQIVWFIDSIVSGEQTPASGLGTLLHSAMETVAPAGVPTGPVTGDQLMSVVDERWSELSTAFEAEWQSTTEKRRAAKLSAAIAAYLSNFDAAGSTLLSNEGGFNLVLDFDDERDADPRDASRGPIRLTVSGKIDRVEAEADGSVVIADLKTGSAASFKVKELPQNGQLTCYQLAVNVNAIEGVPPDAQAGGAKLIFAAAPNAKTPYTERRQAAGDQEFFDAAIERLRKAARGMAGSSFTGRVFESEEQGEFSSRYEYRIHLVKAVTE
jgi:superfamily I DNA/RNA helicase/RecB family exonuclease